MKRTFALLCLFAGSFNFLHAQNEDYWPEKVHYIPGLDVELFGLDKAHSKLVFSIGFFGFSDVEGTFDQYSGSILYNESDLTKTAVNLVIDGNSINTGSGFRDKDLKKENFFDVENHRLLQFQSKEVKKEGDHYLALGALTIKGITKEIEVPFRQTQKRFVDPFWSNLMIAFEGEITLNRLDFDIHGGSWGEKVLSEEVKIKFTLLAQQPNTYKWGSGEKSTKVKELVIAIKEGGLDEAKVLYESLAAEEEMDAFTTGLVAKRLIQKYHFEEAVVFLDFAIEKHPKQAGYYKDLAKAHAYLGNKDKALELYEQIRARNPYDPEAMIMLRQLR